MINVRKRSRNFLSLQWFATFLSWAVAWAVIGSPCGWAEEAQEAATQTSASQDEPADDKSASEGDQEAPPPEEGKGQPVAGKGEVKQVPAPASVVATPVATVAKPDPKLSQSKSKQVKASAKGRSLAALVSTQVMSKEEIAKRSSNGTPLDIEAGAIQKGKRLLAGVALVLEKQSAVLFRARVDTGARLCSIHAEELIIEDPAESMAENVGKTARIRLTNRNDESGWLETRIDRLVRIETSEHSEQRYSVPLVLICREVEKEIQVTLNDRSKMKHPLLLGRNFLFGDFVVDIEIPDPD